MAAIVVEGELSPAQRLALQVVENCLREDLRPVERARAFRSRMEAQDWSARQLAVELSLDPSSVMKALALLELPADQQAEIDAGQVTASEGYQQVKVSRAERTDKPRAPKPRGKSLLKPRTFRMPNVKLRVEPSRKATQADVLADVLVAAEALVAQLRAEATEAA